MTEGDDEDIWSGVECQALWNVSRLHVGGRCWALAVLPCFRFADIGDALMLGQVRKLACLALPLPQTGTLA